MTSNISRNTGSPRVVSVDTVPALLSELRTTAPPGDDLTVIRAGSWDSTLGRNGAVVTSTTKGNALALAVDTDGSYVVAGVSSNERGYPSITIARYDHDGHLDKSFGKTGCVRLDLPYPPDARNDTVATSVAIQADDGSIVVAGTARQPPSAFSFEDLVLARLTSDGRLDSSFANGGWLQLGLGMASAANALSVEPDGRILAAGYIRVPQGGNFQILLMRVTSDGNPDPTFGSGGFVMLPASSDVEEVAAIARQAYDGRIVVAAKQEVGFNKKFVFFRLESDGRLDTTFGNEGRRSLDLGAGDNVIKSIAIQPDRKYVVAGYLESREYVLLRLDPTGNLDPTFGDGGIVTGSFGSGTGAGSPGSSFGEALIVQNDGAIFVGGSVTERLTPSGYVGSMPTYDADRSCALARFLPDGQLDTSFGVGGVVLTDLGKGVNEIHAIALDGDSVITAGQCERGIALLRFHANEPLRARTLQSARPARLVDAVQRVEVAPGLIDASFGTHGFVIDDRLVNPCAMIVDAEGRILVAGMESDASGGPLAGLALGRFTRDGQRDTSFGDAGITQLPTPAPSLPYAIAAAPDGDVYVAAKLLQDSPVISLLALFDAAGGDPQLFVIVLPDEMAKSFEAYAMAIDATGRLLLAGQYDNQFSLARFTLAPTPALDTSFGGGATPGLVLTAFGKGFAAARTLALLSDGRILVAGTADVGSGENPFDFALARYNDDGTLDRRFGKAGTKTISLSGTDDTVHAMAVQSDGGIVLAGESLGKQDSARRALVLRTDSRGETDKTFNDNGAYYESDFPGAAEAVLIDARGRVVIAGYAAVEADLREANPREADFALMRLTF